MTTSLRRPSVEAAEMVWLKGLREGDRQSFDALFDRYFARVSCLVARSGADVETQQAIIRKVLEQLFETLVRSRRGDESGLAHAVLALTCRELARRGLRLRG